MATSIIDTSLHTAAFPTTYTGPGTLIGNPVQPAGVDAAVHGYFTSNGNAVQINLGFQPLHIKVVDVTDALVWEWQYGMPAADSIKITLGTVAAALDTTGAFTIATTPNGVDTVTLSAALCSTGKVISYVIEG